VARRTAEFQTIRSEGGLLPPDLLRRVIDPKEKLEGTCPQDYGLPQSERLNEVITQSWTRLTKHWGEFRASSENLPEGEAATGLTNDKWSIPLLRELGFGLLPAGAGLQLNGRSYAITRVFGTVPIHLVGCGLSLDRRAAGVRGAAAINPHGLVQEFLNRSPDHLWAIASNGIRFRILRDSQTLSRQSFLEFDLEAMFDGQVYSDFVLFWLLSHATRFAPLQGERPESCWLERWTKLANEQGPRALGDLRGGVERALEIFGEGFTSHPKNVNLREDLRTGRLSPTEFHGQLLRLVYRLIFLFVAEDRTIEGLPLLHPRDSSDPARVARERYAAHYSTDRLRELAGKIKGSRHGDFWQQFQIVGRALSGDASFSQIREHLALPALGSFLWDESKTSTLNGAHLTNHDFLEALRHLAFTNQGKMLRRVDYRNLGAEELGGVYESLLALTPQISADGARFTFAEFAGNERKTSGSYYTPDSLVQCLLDSALDPVVEEAVKGKTGVEAEKAILVLKVCDPAVGSGHFLVGAAHRLARHLARVQALEQGESEPSPLLYQHALRDVIGRCVYGVDVNPMAAELCRVSLWLEALEPGKPLSFLDHHIRVGNSLLGTTPELIAAGLPDEAFNPIEGDDKKVCSALKKKNKSEREGQRDMAHLMVAEPEAEYNSIESLSRKVDEAPDDTLDDIHQKADHFQRLVVSKEYEHAELISDAWCAALVWKKQLSTHAAPITTDAIRRLEADPKALTLEQRAEVNRLSNQYQFFHWNLAFPEVFAKGGFDCLLGNPPWERVKLQEQEWFAQRKPEIAGAPNTAKRKRLIQALEHEAPELYTEFTTALRKASGQSHFLRTSGLYPLCGRGDINLFAVFAEAMRSCRNNVGAVGIVVPTALATDTTTQDFFRTILEKQELASLLDFSNEKGLFPTVRGHQQFALMSVRGAANPVARPLFGFYFTDVADLREEGRTFSLSPSDIHLVNPNTFTAPVFRTNADAILMRRLYRHLPVLIREAQGGQPEENEWGISFIRMFDMSNDSHCFRTRKQLEEDGFQSDGILFSNEAKQFLPLFDAKMAQQYNHRAAEIGHSGHQFRKISKEQSSLDELLNPYFCPKPLYYVPATEVVARTQAWKNQWFLGFKDITGTTSIRLAAFAIIPRYGVGHPFPIVLNDGGGAKLALLLGVLNSFPIEYALRQKLQGLHLTYYYLKQIPVPKPAAFSEKCPWDSDGRTYDGWFVPRLLELTYTAWDLENFALDYGWSGPPFRWDEERRFCLRCEIDAALFHLYLGADVTGEWKPASIAKGAIREETSEEQAELKRCFPTPRESVAYIMDTLSSVCRKDEENYNEYRTKRVILEIYEAMQEAIRTGKPYQTRLDPPPADPRCCHPAHDGSLAPGSSWQLSDLMMDLLPRDPFSFQPPLELKGDMKGASWICRVLRATDPLPKQDEWVVIRHPALMKGGSPCGIALGRFRYQHQKDTQTGEAFVHVTLRGMHPPAELNVSDKEWTCFRPLALIEQK
jgi:hypothetical protein